MRLGDLIRDLPIELRRGSPDTVVEAVVPPHSAREQSSELIARVQSALAHEAP